MEILDAGLLNPKKEWRVLRHGVPGRVVQEAVAFDGSKVAIKIVRIVKGKKVQNNDLLIASIRWLAVD